MAELDLSLDHEGQDSLACACWGQGFAPNILGHLSTRQAHRCSISSPAAYLRPLTATTGHAAFHAATYVLPPCGENTTCGLRPAYPFRLRGSSESYAAYLRAFDRAQDLQPAYGPILGRILACKKLQVWQSAKICLTMAKLASASSGAVPIGTSNYLPDESGLPPSTPGFLLAPSAPNSPGHRTCGRDLSSATTQAKNHKKRFRSTVELHHLNRTLQRERVPPRQDCLHRPEKCSEPLLWLQ